MFLPCFFLATKVSFSEDTYAFSIFPVLLYLHLRSELLESPFMAWPTLTLRVPCSFCQDRKYGRTRRELLYEEYVEGSKRGGIGQPKEGFEVRLLRQLVHKHMLTAINTILQWLRTSEVV